jgi:circadian clock protein KaiC
MSVPHGDKVKIGTLPTGVPGLDEILGGGLPEFSFNILAGAPGGGKTTLAHQIVFANATPQRPALYFTVLGEPAIKMLRYQQQFQFFDVTKLDGAIRFVNLSQVVLDNDLDAVLQEIIKEVEADQPGHCCGRFVSHRDSQAALRYGQCRPSEFHPAPGFAPDKLAGDDISHR